MRILVAGANGYLGGRISEYLAARGHHITALVHHLPEDSGKWQKKMGRVVEGDATKQEILASALQDEVDSIVFTISLDHRLSGQDPFKTLAVNVGIFWKLLELYSRKAGGRVIYLSTQQVYGRYESVEVINEETPLHPVNAYGLTHQYCEELGSLYAREKGLKYISIRLSNSFGAPVFADCNCWWLAINDLCKTALQNGELKLLSDGTPQRNFIPVADVCRAIEMIATLPSSALKHMSYNLGSGRSYTILEAAHEIAGICARKYGREFPVILPGNKVSNNAKQHRDMPRFTYDIGRIKEPGFIPSADLRTGIEEVLDFLEKTRQADS
jgi:UDP-glucose 4-epimerase